MRKTEGILTSADRVSNRGRFASPESAGKRESQGDTGASAIGCEASLDSPSVGHAVRQGAVRTAADTDGTNEISEEIDVGVGTEKFLAGTANPNAENKDLENSCERDAAMNQSGASIASKIETLSDARAAQDPADTPRTGKRYRTKRGAMTSKICKIAILTALSTILLLLEFPIFPATPFYQLNFSDVPVLIGTFMFGPLVGALISTLKVLLFFFFKGSSSAFIGEISNIVGGLAFVIPAGLIYGKKHGIKRALVALVTGAVCFSAVMALFNLFALLPWYAKQFMPELTGFRPRLILVLSWCVPFNLIKAVATSIMTFVLYKATRKVFKLF